MCRCEVCVSIYLHLLYVSFPASVHNIELFCFLKVSESAFASCLAR